MDLCDLCSAPAGFRRQFYSSGQFKSAVRRGLRPPDRAFELGAAMGMSRGQTETVWLQRVASDGTGWLLCVDCDSKHAKLLSRRWWQFWRR